VRQSLKPPRPLVREETCFAVVLLHIVGVTARVFWGEWGGPCIRITPISVLPVNTILSLPNDNCAAETSEQNDEAEEIKG
jgi:hypothetical protein